MNKQSIEKLKNIELESYGLEGKDLAVAGFVKRYFAELAPNSVASKIAIARANGVKYLLNLIYMEIGEYLLPVEAKQPEVRASKEWLLRDDLNFKELENLLDDIDAVMQL